MLTEQTPLLSADEDEIPHVSSEESTPTGTPTPNQPLGQGRALLIILSICILIFLQGKWHPRSHPGIQGLTQGTASNMSGITTAQSTIADDLDVSGEDAIWFTSAYLVRRLAHQNLLDELGTYWIDFYGQPRTSHWPPIPDFFTPYLHPIVRLPFCCRRPPDGPCTLLQYLYRRPHYQRLRGGGRYDVDPHPCD